MRAPSPDSRYHWPATRMGNVMTTIQRIAFASAVATLLVGCGSAEAPDPEPPPVDETVFGDMAGTIDKARSVEDVTLQRKEELNKAMEESERADQP